MARFQAKTDDDPGGYEPIEHGPSDSAATARGRDPHALDLGSRRTNALECGGADRFALLDCQNETTVWGKELPDRGKVAFDCLLHRKSESVPSLEPVVGPVEVIEP